MSARKPPLARAAEALGSSRWLSAAGFAAVVFTYWGVNFVLSGLHSYA